MAEKSKRYSIVRVDIKCPIGIEEDISEIDRVKMFNCIGKRQCGDCPYGDTKEQLIRKVAQIIRKQKITYFEERVIQIAKEIVEFLGVE